MKINSFRAGGVHEYLNYDIKFSSNLNFLIGINGSGKTSALKLILGLTSPSYNYLNNIKYNFCEVICSSSEDEQDIIIRAEQQPEYFTLSLKYKNEKILTDSFKRFIKNPNIYNADEVISLEQTARQNFEQKSVTKKIRGFTTPKFLGLDRSIYEGVQIDHRLNKNRRIFLHPTRKQQDELSEPQSIDLSLLEVQELIYKFVRRVSSLQIQINEDFKESVFNDSFQFFGPFTNMPKSSDIAEKKKQVVDAIEGLGLQRLFTNINKFFLQLETVTKQYEMSKDKEHIKDKKSEDDHLEVFLKYMINSPQLKRIDDIIQYSQDYQNNLEEIRSPIKKLENLVTNFLKEGKKSLEISPDGEMRVLIKNQYPTNIFSLSSGEKQIIIMIAHLIFEEAEKEKGIFIIDEPELSLHIAWQQIFVQSILEASPKTQFILATHAPSIISEPEYEQYCQDLTRLNF